MDSMLEIGLSNAVAAAVLAVLALALGSLCRRRPALVHGLWLLVLLKLLTPPLVRVPLSWPEPAPAGTPAEGTDAPLSEAEPAAAPPMVIVEEMPEANAMTPEPPIAARAPELIEAAETSVPEEPPLAALPWRQLLAGVWLGGSCGWLGLASWRLYRFRRLLRHARLAPQALQERVTRLGRRMGLKRCPRVWLMPGRVAPLVWSLGGEPRLLLPAGLPEHISAEELETILVHELAHLRRRDHWVRHVEFLAMGLYWWHPGVWYARRVLREAEEQCCDAWVVAALPGAGRTYANALIDTLDFLCGEGPVLPLAASGLGPVSDLKRRLTMILSERTPRGLGWLGGLALLTAAVLLLPCLPAWGQQEGESQEAQAQKVADEEAARLKQMEANLQKQHAELAAAAARLKLAQAELKRAQAAADAAKQRAGNDGAGEKVQGRWKIEKGQAMNVKKKSSIHVIVHFDGDNEGDVKEMVGRLRKVLPESATVAVVRGGKGAPANFWTEANTGAQYYIGVQRVESDGQKSGKAVYGKGAPVPVPPGVTGSIAVFPGKPGTVQGKVIRINPETDPRIDKLEKRLNEVLMRLDKLQHELDRRHGPNDSTAPGK